MHATEGSTVIYGIGVDLIEIERIAQAITRTGQRLIERLYTDAEQAYCCRQHHPYACYAARFAAKEALLKALGTGLRQHMRWRDIEVCRDDLGKPSGHRPSRRLTNSPSPSLTLKPLAWILRRGIASVRLRYYGSRVIAKLPVLNPWCIRRGRCTLAL